MPSVKDIIIREEREEDFYNTEHMIMRSFWNIHGPGCNEHLLAHKLRNSKDYIRELSRVAEINGKIVGTIMYSKAKIIDDQNQKNYEILTFGLLAVEPTCFNEGIGGLLLRTTIQLAKENGYPGIVIIGEPDYYPKHGFLTCDNFKIEHSEYGNFDAFMAYSLNKEFEMIHGKFYGPHVFEECNDEKEIQEFNQKFPSYIPLKLSCQWLHKEKLGQIIKIQNNSKDDTTLDNKYIIKFWEKEIPAILNENFLSSNITKLPSIGDYVTFEYKPSHVSIILSVCEKI